MPAPSQMTLPLLSNRIASACQLPAEGKCKTFLFFPLCVFASLRLGVGLFWCWLDQVGGCKRNASSSTSTGNRRRAILLPIIVLSLLILVLAGCAPAGTPPVVKIGLIAPFEGPSRPLGYSVLYGVRLRLQQWNDAGNTPRVELVALNDDGDPEMASSLPVQLAVDPDILLVIGPPQGHTALAALPALMQHQLPTLSLAPLPDSNSGPVLPYAGTDADLQLALSPYAGSAKPARALLLVGPVIWVGDPLTLSDIMHDSPELAPAVGSVAAEAAFAAWAGDVADGLVWSQAYPDDLPPDFAGAYEALAGTPPTPMSALAYAAAGEALQLLSQSQDRQALAESINDLNPYPQQVFQRQGDACCIPLSPDF